MSVSTDGILCFGVDLGYEEELYGRVPWFPELNDEEPEEDEEGFEGRFDAWRTELAGGDGHDQAWARWETWDAANPRPDLPLSGRMELWEQADPEGKAALSASYKRRREIEEASPIQLVRHGYGDEPCWIIAVPGTVVKASRGSPVVVDRTRIVDDPDGLAAARAFCLDHGIPAFTAEERPGWLLASLWW